LLWSRLPRASVLLFISLKYTGEMGRFVVLN
jgi:hypothetical protein